ncbi:TPA: hypothetical protein ACG4NB_004774, partial [Stenotrophomonas maltophilia]
GSGGRCSAQLLVGVDLGRHDFSVRYRMNHPRMAWIYRVDQGQHLPEQSTKVDTDQNNMPFRQIAESVEGGVGPVAGA